MPRSKSNENQHDLIQAGYGFAVSLTHHPEDAEDLVQQACFRVISKKGRLESRAYLFKTIRNLHYDILRRRKVVRFESIDESTTPPSDSISMTPELGIQMDLESKLNQLETEEREVLFLNCVEGYTAAELSTMMEKPRSTVLNILSRAKTKMAELEDQENDDLDHG